MIVVLFGPPGSGKGTQAERIAALMGIPHVSTGEILRAEAASGSALGREAALIMQTGALIPDDLMIRIIEQRIAQPDAGKGVVLDGFPRTVAQAEALERMLERAGPSVLVVVCLDVSPEQVRERILRRAQIDGRKDDTADTFSERMRVYERETAPVVDHFRAAGVRIERIDGAPPADQVTEQIVRVLGVPDTDRPRSVATSS
ncbi:MAG: adenylate kinase [Candidatus Dormiibacterota bacterium]